MWRLIRLRVNLFVWRVFDDRQDWVYEFIHANDKYYVSRNDYQQFFEISQHDYERITHVNMAQLALDSAEESAENTEDAASQS